MHGLLLCLYIIKYFNINIKLTKTGIDLFFQPIFSYPLVPNFLLVWSLDFFLLLLDFCLNVYSKKWIVFNCSYYFACVYMLMNIKAQSWLRVFSWIIFHFTCCGSISHWTYCSLSWIVNYSASSKIPLSLPPLHWGNWWAAKPSWPSGGFWELKLQSLYVHSKHTTDLSRWPQC